VGVPVMEAEPLADGKGRSARACLKEARVQRDEPTNRNCIEGPNMDTRRSRGQLVRGVEPDPIMYYSQRLTLEQYAT